MASSYSAIKLKMGTWDYYVIKMTMSSLAREVKFAHEVNNDKTLDGAIQRALNENRSKKQIIKYLQRNEERFFSSIVIAAFGGNPKFFPLDPSGDENFEFFQHEVIDTFGVLRFGDDLKIYALDGQHRLFAIKELVDGSSDSPAPQGFSDETISVIFVLQPPDKSQEEFKKSYRRLFSSLNRHAKPMDKATNIIMDEDDRFAIATRYLIREYEFFQWDGTSNDEMIIDAMTKSESIQDTSPRFATIVGFYKMNMNLLWDENCLDWGEPVMASSNLLLQETPTDEEIEDLQNYLVKIWDSLLLTLPDLKRNPTEMRHMSSDGTDSKKSNSLWFRPIGQTEILSKLARNLMTESGINKDSSQDDILKALAPIKLIPSELSHNFWRDFLINLNPENMKYVMTSEQRGPKLKLALNILLWVCGLETWSEDHIEEIQERWSAYLIPPGDNDREEKTFRELEKIREKIIEIREQ